MEVEARIAYIMLANALLQLDVIGLDHAFKLKQEVMDCES